MLNIKQIKSDTAGPLIFQGTNALSSNPALSWDNTNQTLEIEGKTSDNTTNSFDVKDSSGDSYFTLRNDKKLFYRDGNQGVGKIFVSDATGGITWTAISGDATINGTGVISLNLTNLLNKPLTGFTPTAGGAVIATDTILQGFGKLQYQISNFVTGVSSVNGQTGAVSLTTNNIPENTNLYFTESRVRATVLTGFTSSASTITAADSILSALGKSQGQIDTKLPYSGANANLNMGSFSVTATSFVKAGGTSSQFLKADGSIDTSTYLTTISGIAAGGELSGTYANPTLLNSAVLAKVLTGLNITGSSITAADSILTAFGKIQNQINGVLGGAIYQGVYNATTNTPTLIDGTGTKGYYYVVNVSGVQNFGSGTIDFNVGDWAIYNGSIWQKVDNTDAVTSVNGFIGAVNLTTSNISEGSNLYYTNARGIGSILTGYTSGAGTVSASDSILQAIQKLNGNMTTLYVPYLNANQTVDLNTQRIKAGNIILGSGTIGNGVPLNISTGLSGANADIWLSSTSNSRILFNNDTTSIQWALQNQTLAGGLDEFSIGLDRTNPTSAVFRITPTENVKIGNNVVTGQRKLRIGQDTAIVDIGSLVGATSLAAIYLNQLTPTLNNFTLASDGTNLLINAATSTSQQTFVMGNSVVPLILKGDQSGSLALPTAKFTASTRLISTASLNFPNWDFFGGNTQWSTGTIASQYEFLLRSPTWSAVGASTITNAFNLYVQSGIAGTNMTVTNNYALGTDGNVLIKSGTSTIQLGNLFGSTTVPAIYLNTSTPSGTNYTLTAVTGGTILNDNSVNNTITFQGNGNSILQIVGTRTSGTLSNFSLSSQIHTGATASTAIRGYTFGGTDRTWVNGGIATSITTQIESAWSNAVYRTSGGGTLSFTNVYGHSFEAPTLMANVSATNIFAARFLANVEVIGTIKIVDGNQGSGKVFTSDANGVGSWVTPTGGTTYTFTSGLTNTANTITNNLITGLSGGQTIIGGTQVGDGLIYKSTTANATLSAAAHTFTGANNGASTFATIYNNGNLNIGNAVTTNQRLVRIGQDSIAIDFGSLFGSTTIAALYMNQLTPSGTNYVLASNAASTQLNSPSGSNVVISINNNSRAIFNSSNTTFVLGAGASDQISYQFTIPTAVSNTASTEFSGFKINGSTSKQWNTGTLALQREFYLTSTTYAFVAPSTITNAYAMYVEAGIAGTNTTITNNYAAGFEGNMRLIGSTVRLVLGNLNSFISDTTGLLNLSSGNSANLNLQTNGVTAVSLTSAMTTGANTSFTLTQQNNTNQTASTAIPGFRYVGASRTWLAGNIATQIENDWGSTIYTASGASVITNAYGNFFRAPVPSTNITITNNWGIGTDGNISLGNLLQFGLLSRIYESSGLVIASAASNPLMFRPNNGNILYQINVQNASASLGAHIMQGVSNTSTNQTLSTEISGFRYTFGGNTRQWATGTINTQREFYITAANYSFVGASVITNAYGLYVEAAIAGTNATITNNYAAGFNGAILLAANNSAIFGNDSGGTRRQLLDFVGDNVRIIGRPGVSDLYLDPSSGGIGLIVKSNGDAGLGAGSPSGKLHIIKTTEQLRIGYDLSNYVSHTISSTGIINYSAVGTSPGFNFGNAVSTNQRLVRIGQDSAFLDIGSGVGSTSTIRMYSNQTTPNATNFSFDLNQADTTINAPNNTGSIAFQTGNTSRFIISGQQTTGASISFSFAKPNNTNQTASTAITGWNYNGGTRQWSTGNITTQIENNWGATTYSFVGASIITNAYGNYFNAPIAGTNTTITNNYAAGFNGNVQILGSLSSTVNTGTVTLREWVSIPAGSNAIYMGTVTPNSNNFILGFDGSSTYLNSFNSNSVYISVNANTVSRYLLTAQQHTPSASTTGAITTFTWTKPNNTNQTASTAIAGWNYIGGTRQWAAGNIATQIENNWGATTYSAIGASVITEAFGNYFNAAIASTNITITNNYALGTNGNAFINGSLRIVDGTQQNGYVFTSDANGVGSWQPAGGGSSTTVLGTANQITVNTVGSTATVSLPTSPHIAGTLFVGSTSGIQWGDGGGISGATNGFLSAVSDGVFRFGDSAGGGSPRIILGSASSTFVAIQRNSTFLEVRLGDNSAYGSLRALNATFTGTSNQIILGTTNTTTISATAPASSFTATLPDWGGNDTFIGANATQTMSNKRFTNATYFGSNTAATANVDIEGSVAGLGSLRIRAGVANASISSPIPGLINHSTDNNFYAYLNGSWKQLNNNVGSSTLVGGTVVVSSTSVTTTCKIIVTGKGNGGNLGSLSEIKASRVNGTSFVITSSNVLDTQDFDWLITE